MRAQAYGDRGWLITDMSDRERANCLGALEETLPAGCREYVVGYDSVLLVGEPSALRDATSGLIHDSGENGAPTSSRTIEIPVHYDGPDLKSVAGTIGVSVDEVISRHSAPVYTVRMMGFSPGFPYLDGLHPSLVLERRASPRVRIEPGSVAIGGPHAGVYTVASPGAGISSGAATPNSSNPMPQRVIVSFLQKFSPFRSAIRFNSDPSRMLLEIERTGVHMNLQDDGRSGWRRFGVPAAGAMDREAMLVANTLSGTQLRRPSWRSLIWVRGYGF